MNGEELEVAAKEGDKIVANVEQVNKTLTGEDTNETTSQGRSKDKPKSIGSLKKSALPDLGQPGGKDDPLRRGLSGKRAAEYKAQGKQCT